MSSKRREASKSPNAKSSLDGKAEDSKPSPYSRRRTEPAKKEAEDPGQSESPQPGQSSSSVQTSSLNVSPMQKFVENNTGAKNKVSSKFKPSPNKGALCPTVGLDFESAGPSASSECRSGAPFLSLSSERDIPGGSSHYSTRSSPHRKTERSTPSSGHLSPHRVAEGSTPSSGHLSPHRVAEGSTPSSRRSSHLEMLSLPDARSAGSSPSRVTLNIDTYQTPSNPCSSRCYASNMMCGVARCNKNLCGNCPKCKNHCWHHCCVTCLAHCEVHAPVNNSNYGCMQRTLYQGGQTSSERSSRLQEVHLGQGGTVDSALGRSPGTSSSGAVGPIDTVCRSYCTNNGVSCQLLDCLKPGTPCVRCCRECPVHCQICCRATCSSHCGVHFERGGYGNPCQKITN